MGGGHLKSRWSRRRCRGRLIGEVPFSFLIVLEGASDPCSSFLSVRVGSLWQLCCSGKLSSLSVTWPRYYPPEWSICLPIDTIPPWLRVDQGKGTGRKG